MKTKAAATGERKKKCGDCANLRAGCVCMATGKTMFPQFQACDQLKITKAASASGKRVSCLITPDQHKALQARAKAENRRPCYVIADAIAFYLANGYNAGLITMDGEALDHTKQLNLTM